MGNNNRRGRSSLSFGEKMLFLAGILLCLVLITTAMMGGLFARYVSEDTGHDKARVATFGQLTLTETGDFTGKKGMIIPGVNLKKQARVSFAPSEVATYVFVEITAPGWTKAGDNRTFSYDPYLQWSVLLDDPATEEMEGWFYLDTEEGTSFVYYRPVAPNAGLTDVDIFAPLTDDQGNDTDFHISVSKDAPESFIDELKPEELDITLNASVIQSGGFETVEEAWAYLAG